MALLEVRELTVAFPAKRGWLPVVHDVSFDLAAGSTLGLVGESGSGKTVTALSLVGLTTSLGARIMSGSVRLDGTDLLELGERRLSDVRGKDVGVIFQQPIRSLDPAFTVGHQIAESVRRHQGGSRRAAWARAVQMLEKVHIAEAATRAHYYPHQLSGGMCQRVMIAIALACDPKLLIADEPTTALDVTVQARILELLLEIQAETGVAIIFVSHDLGVIAEMCNDVAVMYAGEIIESSPIEELFTRPRHPYTQGLLDSIPKPGHGRRYHPIPGTIPPAGELPDGCRFHPRCPHTQAGRCDVVHPMLEPNGDRAAVRCVRAEEIVLTGIGSV